MTVRVARHAGFCTGVEQAVHGALKAAESARQRGLKCYSLGELIHNPLVVAELEAQGIQAVERPEQAAGAVLVLRSHGVSPQVEAEARRHAAEVVDCTCRFVKHLHEQVSRFSQDGAAVILVGDRQHPEVIGTAGWCKGEVHVVANEAEVDSLPDSAAEALVAAQTTLAPDSWERITRRLIERFPGLTLKRTICAATALRQQEARELASQVDVMVVVGGRHSANTRKLYETCQEVCGECYLVESAEELPPRLRDRSERCIGVTAGASTPERSLKEVVDRMNDMERKDLAPEPEIKEPAAPETVPAQEPQAVEPAVPAEAPAVEAPEAEAAAEAAAPAEAEAAAAEPEAPAAEAEAAEPAAEEAAAEAEAASEDAAAEAAAPAEAAGEPAAEAAPAEGETAAEPAKEQSPQATFMDQVAASMTRIRNGQTLTGKVVQLSEDEVCVNIGYKSDGLLKRTEMVDQDVELGDEIEVEVVKVNDGEGNVILSQRNIVNRKTWEGIVAKYEAGEFVDAVGKEAVKGGLLASIEGVRAFVPASHLSQRYVEKISQFVGQEMKLKIIEIDNSKKRVVASRKEVLAEEMAAKREAVWANLVEGSVVKGIVRRFASFGAFVDLGGVDGLIHITDLSWNRSAQPQDVLKANEEIDVKILSLDRERERIQLGYKQLQPRPWDNVEEKYPVGTILTRNVVRIRPFGAFIELEPGVDGLVHISQVALTRIDRVEDVLHPGQEVNVKVLAVDPDAKRISLSIREAMDQGTYYDYQQDVTGQDHAVAYEAPQEPVQAPAPQTVEEAISAPESPMDTSIAAAFKRAAQAAEEAQAEAAAQEEAPAEEAKAEEAPAEQDEETPEA